MVLESENCGESGECVCVCVAEIRRSSRPLAAYCRGANTMECCQCGRKQENVLKININIMIAASDLTPEHYGQLHSV
jgi:hypothetical protein